jgi:hypothetical protein
MSRDPHNSGYARARPDPHVFDRWSLSESTVQIYLPIHCTSCDRQINHHGVGRTTLEDNIITVFHASGTIFEIAAQFPERFCAMGKLSRPGFAIIYWSIVFRRFRVQIMLCINSSRSQVDVLKKVLYLNSHLIFAKTIKGDRQQIIENV